jgi:hypothetical protein
LGSGFLEVLLRQQDNEEGRPFCPKSDLPVLTEVLRAADAQSSIESTLHPVVTIAADLIARLCSVKEEYGVSSSCALRHSGQLSVFSLGD